MSDLILFENNKFYVSLVCAANRPDCTPLPPYRAKENELSKLGRYAAGELFSLFFQKKYGKAPANESVLSQNIKLNDFGKPFSADHPDFHYNISHSGSYAAAIYCPYANAGIDIQEVRPYNQRVAERCFSPEKNARLALLTGHQQDIEYTRAWAKKESLAKAAGVGLAHKYDEEKYTLVDLSDLAPEGFVLCVAYERRG